MRTILTAVAIIVILGEAAVILLGREYWPLDLVTFFWPLAALFVGFLFLASLLVAGFAVKLFAAVALALALYPLFNLPAAPDPGTGNRLRLLTANLYVGNPDPHEFVALLAGAQPDIVVTQETLPRFALAVRASGLFPFESTGSLIANDDKKVFSRYPIREQTQLSEAAGSPPLRRHPMRLVIDAPDGPVVLYAIHSDTPRSLEQWHQRNAYFDLLAHYIGQEPEGTAIVVAGDWNMPAYSPFFARFFDETGLSFARPGWYLPVTRFYTRMKRYAYLGSTIDHVALSPGLKLMNWQRGRDIGSNHLPVIVDIVLPSSNAVAQR